MTGNQLIFIFPLSCCKGGYGHDETVVGVLLRVISLVPCSWSLHALCEKDIVSYWRQKLWAELPSSAGMQISNKNRRDAGRWAPGTEQRATERQRLRQLSGAVRDLARLSPVDTNMRNQCWKFTSLARCYPVIVFRSTAAACMCVRCRSRLWY